jgi:hypothetical protein
MVNVVARPSLQSLVQAKFAGWVSGWASYVWEAGGVQGFKLGTMQIQSRFLNKQMLQP